jgi:hypothetical protein
LPAKLPVVERRPVVVIDLAGTTPSKNLQDELREELFKHDALKPLIDPAVAVLVTGPLVDEDDANLRAARKNRDEAQASLASFDLSVAKDKAGGGLDQLLVVAPSPTSIGIASDLALVMAQAKLGDGAPDNAAKYFTLVHRLTPNRYLDPARYLPEVVAAYQAAKPTSQLPAAVEVDGHQGRVYIDGIDVGVPNATFEVAPGMHIIQIAGLERDTRGERDKEVWPPVSSAPQAIRITIEDRSVGEEVQIRRTRLALAHASDPVQRANLMKTMIGLVSKAVKSPVTDALLVLQQNGKIVAQGWRSNMPGFKEPIFNAPVDGQTVYDRPAEMLSWFAPPRPLHSIENDGELPPPPPAWYEKRWVQASAVGAILVIALGGYLYSLRGGGMNDVNPILK